MTEGAVTDNGGHFLLEATQYDAAIGPNDTIEFRYLDEIHEATVPILTFDSYDRSGRASGTAVGLDELSDVVVQIRAADGSRREESAHGVRVTAGVWSVQLDPLLEGDRVEEAQVGGRLSLFWFLSNLDTELP